MIKIRKTKNQKNRKTKNRKTKNRKHRIKGGAQIEIMGSEAESKKVFTEINKVMDQLKEEQ